MSVKKALSSTKPRVKKSPVVKKVVAKKSVAKKTRARKKSVAAKSAASVVEASSMMCEETTILRANGERQTMINCNRCSQVPYNVNGLVGILLSVIVVLSAILISSSFALDYQSDRMDQLSVREAVAGQDLVADPLN